MSQYTPFSDIEKDHLESVKILIQRYLRNWPWFIISLVIFAGLGVGYILCSTPLHEATASILIKDNSNRGNNTSMLEELDFFSSSKVLENEIAILKSYTLTEYVVRALNLQVTYYSPTRLGRKEVFDNSPVAIEILSATPALYESPLLVNLSKSGHIIINDKEYPVNAIITESFGSIRVSINDSLLSKWDKYTPLEAVVSPISSTVRKIRQDIKVVPEGKGASVLRISTLSPVRKKAEEIINQLIATYNEASVTDKNNLARLTLSFIDERIELLSADVKEVEQKMEEYRSSRGITNINTESQLFLQATQRSEEGVRSLRTQLEILQNIEQFVLSRENSPSAIPAMFGISDATLNSLVTNLVAVETERTVALRTVKPANPIILAYDDQINILKNNILDNIKSLRKNLETAQKQLLADIRRMEALIQAVPKKERELSDITRQQDIKNQLYVYLLSKREETAIAYASTISDSRLIDSAHSTPKPIKPVKHNVIAIFLLAGLLFPVLLIWMRDLFHTKLESRDEIERWSKASIIGEISQSHQVSKGSSLGKSRSRVAEQFRTLRTNLSFMIPDNKLQTILITSGISGEGKSFIATNLGTIFANLQKPVIVLGFDLRKPGLHKTFGIKNTQGLSNYLSGQSTLEQVIQKIDGNEFLHVITCGHIVPNPQELLLGNTLPALMKELKTRYQYIIIDSAPIGLISDAQILEKYVDFSIFVMRQYVTPKDRIKHINSFKLKNMGIVMNGVKDTKWYGYRSPYDLGKYYGKYNETLES